MKNPLLEAKRWYEQAWNDWEFVIWLSGEEKFFDKGCFITQQASEKVLKACLYAVGERIVISHSTADLAEKLVKHSPAFDDIINSAKRLDRFYIPTRYPNGLPGGAPYKHFSKDDFKMAIADGQKIIETSQAFLKKKGMSL